ncbi:hypothetical protein Hypma_007924 [Hypsizygus marmoreus]|uniref:Vacuolar sorting protein Vps3844 C-terminal domain-containing protein n=1 Tax=Hypsizygus marmoreus TaxID=39966 RepID=A0A369K0I0_HYPMA|nr:hypothetical protein Hypma_007924 [Hypsizygus marmoreus]
MLPALAFGLLLSILQFSQAINVYLNPHSSFLRSSLSPNDASSTLSRHLGLELFEPLRDASNAEYNVESFVGQGPSNALLLTMDEADAKAVLPASLQPSFKLSAPSESPIDSLASVVSTYLHRAQHSYASIYSEDISWQLHDIDSLTTFFETAEAPSFAAVELKQLSDLRQRYGPTSEEYAGAATKIRHFLERAYQEADTFHTALLTFSSSPPAHAKREPQTSQSPLPPTSPPPQEPIGSISTCFSSAEACTNGTSSCSGRGQCVEANKAGRTCFICLCGVTKTGEGAKVKTDTWVGQSCERKDVSGPFVLLAGTTIVLIILAFGSVSLLSSVGDLELPSTLLATAVNARRD